MSNRSHGFRPSRGCHTALQEIQTKWTGSRWFVEGDIAKFFDTMDHEVLLTILSEKIHDNRFLRVLRHLLESGYLEDWKFNKTLSGCPQGGVISPILSNIYLGKLDQYVEKTLIPAYTRGERRAVNPVYQTLKAKERWQKRLGNSEEAKELRKQSQKVFSCDPNDDTYRRLFYVKSLPNFKIGKTRRRVAPPSLESRIANVLTWVNPSRGPVPLPRSVWRWCGCYSNN